MRSRRLAQTAATIGREFDYDLLGAVSPLSFEKLRDSLRQLIDAGLMFRRGRSQEGAYIFKHALVQDAAYGSLLKSKRQALHRTIAEALQERFPERVESEPELLAHHFTEAGMTEPAIEQWKKAGLGAMDASANYEAASQFGRALELFHQLEDAEERLQEELELQTSLAAALNAAGDWTATVWDRARELCHRVADLSQTFPVLYGVWAMTFVTGPQGALELAEELMQLAQKDKERIRVMSVHNALGLTLVHVGQLEAAHGHLEKSISLYESRPDESLWQVYGETPPLMALPYHSWNTWFKGFPEQALIQSQAAVDMTQHASDMSSTGTALCLAAALQVFCGDGDVAHTASQAALDFGTELDFPPFRVFGAYMQGIALLEQGDPEEGTQMIESALGEWKEIGLGLHLHSFFGFLAQGHHRCGNKEKALELLDDAFEASKLGGEHYWRAELNRLRGTFLLSLSTKNAPEAETSFRQAIDVAREQSARSLELRAATSLARLWHDQGKRDEARELLTPIYDWFTEGFDIPDLKEAKALLNQLA